MGRAFGLANIILACIGLAGCGGRVTGPAKVEVEGKVTHGGKGVPLLIVTFNGATSADKHDTHTEADGTFKLACPPGSYKVSLTAVPLGEGQGPSGGAGDGTLAKAQDAKGLKQVPRNYQSPNTTPLQVDVPHGGRKDVDLPIE